MSHRDGSSRACGRLQTASCHHGCAQERKLRRHRTGCLVTPRWDKRRRTNADAVPAALSGHRHRNMACPPDNIVPHHYSRIPGRNTPVSRLGSPSPAALLERGKRGPTKQLQCSVDAHPNEESVQRVINRRAVADPRLRHRELPH
ncbi:hypothetical protein ISCGN_004196 [Ixodes scapularis]